MSLHHEFSEAALTELLRALRARSASHPEDPGLVASWPAVREDRMAAACAELRRRGHPVQRVSNPSAKHSATGDRWAIGVATKEPAPSLTIVADAATDEPATLSHNRRLPS